MSVNLLENELFWREGEIVRLKKLFITLPESSSSRDTLLKCMILLCYSHFEGIIKSSINMLIDEINNGSYQIKQLKSHCAMTALKPFVCELKNKMDHRLICDVLLEKKSDHLDEIATIAEPKGNKNMWPKEIDRLLEEVGIVLPEIDQYHSTISTLVNIRNDLAHGENRRVKSFADYQLYEAAARDVSLAIVVAVHNCATERSYLAHSECQ